RSPPGDRLELPPAGHAGGSEADPNAPRRGRLVRRSLLALEAVAVADVSAVHARQPARLGSLAGRERPGEARQALLRRQAAGTQAAADEQRRRRTRRERGAHVAEAALP